MLLSIRTTFTPAAIALSSAGATVGSTGVRAMPCTPLVTIDSMSAICPSMSVADCALAEDDLDARIGRGVGLGGVLHGGEERHRELGDEADLDRVLRHGGPGDRCGERQPSQ